MPASTTLNRENAEFWTELCGSLFAQRLGIKDHRPESLERFDKAYLDYYPYLLKYVDLSKLAGKKVMEVGLGYGTLSQKIAEAGADYIGLDISPGPVSMVNHRMKMKGLSGKAMQGSILNCPMPDESLDFVVSIGCFHHTGNVQKSLDETYRVLKPGGAAILMVYSRFSYRQWVKWPTQTFLALMKEWGVYGGKLQSTENQRKTYDCDTEGNAAPETVFLSIRQLKKMLMKFSSIELHKENCGNFRIKGITLIPRDKMLSTLGRFWGVDTDIIAKK